jgi:hypothetical protein
MNELFMYSVFKLREDIKSANYDDHVKTFADLVEQTNNIKPE